MSPAEQQQIHAVQARLDVVVRMIEQSQWLEERREDVIGTLRFIQLYLERISRNGS